MQSFPSAEDFKIHSLGAGRIPSPLKHLSSTSGKAVNFVTENDTILFEDRYEEVQKLTREGGQLPVLELAGARENLFFEPAHTTCAIVTCGGICPGLNDVVRGIVMQLYHQYGVTRIYGVRYGYQGLIKEHGLSPMRLTPEVVTNIHMLGGTILGTSRGPQDVPSMVDTLEEMKVNILFVIGGDGSLRGAMEIEEEVRRRGQAISVIGIPKTIDNDINLIDKSFGFETAFAESTKAIECAHTESLSSPNGVGLVKLMGRQSGFITCFASLGVNSVNFALIPEVPFRLEGENGFLEALRRRLERRKHAVIVVSEGAGQDLCGNDSKETDASGNEKFSDIGLYLKKKIEDYFNKLNMELNLKYIDPSYTIRSVPAAPQDSVFCSRLAQHAVHAGMSGKTGMVVGRWHGRFVYIPLSIAVSGRRKVNPREDLWISVIEATGQPVEFK